MSDGVQVRVRLHYSQIVHSPKSESEGESQVCYTRVQVHMIWV